MSAPAADTAGASWKLLWFDMLLWITQQHMKCHAGSTGSPLYRTEDLTTKSFLEITHQILCFDIRKQVNLSKISLGILKT